MCADNDNDYDVAYANDEDGDDDGDTGVVQKKKGGQVGNKKKRQDPPSSKKDDRRKPSVNVNKYARNKGKVPVNEHRRRPPVKAAPQEEEEEEEPREYDNDDVDPLDEDEDNDQQDEEEQFSGGEDADDEEEQDEERDEEDPEQDNRASKRYQRQQIAKAKNRPPPMTVQEFLKLDMNEMEREINDRQVGYQNPRTAGKKAALIERDARSQGDRAPGRRDRVKDLAFREEARNLKQNGRGGGGGGQVTALGADDLIKRLMVEDRRANGQNQHIKGLIKNAQAGRYHDKAASSGWGKETLRSHLAMAGLDGMAKDVMQLVYRF